LLERRGVLEAALPTLAKAGLDTIKTRFHGDFHLGQVLTVQGDAYLIDFEGEPAKPIAERRAKGSALRDVAGLLRSFDYAAASVVRAVQTSTDRARDREQSMVRRFVNDAGANFIDAYRAAAAAAPHSWVSDAAWDDLLTLFLIEKSAYEVCYEAANRPTWLIIPLTGLAQLTTRITTGASDARLG
jgi:maltose alpha-D-glucosyltransferase/alpha-amylase